jgi:broad-specificity NMP kinase
MAAFAQLVTGPPGAGKTTYCHGMHQVSQRWNLTLLKLDMDAEQNRCSSSRRSIDR